jgi:hypothetical protein
MWKEAAMASFQYIPEGTKEIHEKLQSGQLVSMLRFEFKTSQTKSKSASHTTAMFTNIYSRNRQTHYVQLHCMIHNFRDWCCHLYNICSSMMQW